MVVKVDPPVAEIVDVRFPTWAKLSSKDAVDGGVRIAAVDLEDQVKPGNNNVMLATLVVKGIREGEGRIYITVKRMDDDRGDPVNPRVETGLLSVGSTATKTTATPRQRLG